MADQPDVLKRLDEVEAVYDECPSILWLLKLTRALLESQGELLEALECNCRVGSGCAFCAALRVRSEKARKGELP